MLLNADALNTAALNSTGGSTAVEPQPIVPGSAFNWRLRLLVDGVDRSAALNGTVTVDRERGASGIADFSLHLPAGPGLLPSWKGRTVTLDYISESGGLTTEVRRFTGRIDDPNWDAQLLLLTCECSDQLQQRVEALSIEDIDALTGGHWSADVYESPIGRSRWDYAQERLESVTGSLDCSPTGELRLTSWFAGTADFVFGPDTTLYNTFDVSDADLGSLTNRVEIEADYRFPLLRQLNQSYSWEHPGTDGFSGLAGFCRWRTDNTEVPDVPMVVSATEGSGQRMVDSTYNRLPLSNADPCGTGAGWINHYPDLILGASWTAGRRWVQSITEHYPLTVLAEASIAQVGEIYSRDSSALEVDSDLATAWEDEDFGEGTNDSGVIGDDGTELVDPALRDEPRRQAFLRCLLNRAYTQIIRAHSGTIITWEDPTSMVMDVDLVHVLEPNDQGVHARARCYRVHDSFDLEGGTAVTALSIAVMRGGGSTADPLVPPASPPLPEPEPPGGATPAGLPTQLGLRNESPIYDDELDGFAGNYTETDEDINPDLERFPRRFTITAAEVPAEQRDELVLDAAAVYRVVIPNDLLEL